MLHKGNFVQTFQLHGHRHLKHYKDFTTNLIVMLLYLRLSVNNLPEFTRHRMLGPSEKCCWGAQKSQQEKQQQKLGILDDLYS